MKKIEPKVFVDALEHFIIAVITDHKSDHVEDYLTKEHLKDHIIELLTEDG